MNTMLGSNSLGAKVKSLLPEIGSRQRDQLEALAIEVGLAAIHDTDGNIPEALYQVYEHFRAKFLEEYELLDSPPGGRVWDEALKDARILERHVSECWATAIVHAYTLRLSRGL